MQSAASGEHNEPRRVAVAAGGGGRLRAPAGRRVSPRLFREATQLITVVATARGTGCEILRVKSHAHATDLTIF